MHGVKETTIKQRLFSARNLIRQEEEKGTGKATMEKMENKPVAFQKIDYEIWGTGMPTTGDPRALADCAETVPDVHQVFHLAERRWVEA